MKFSFANILGIFAIAFICGISGTVFGFLWAILTSGVGSDSTLGVFNSSTTKSAFVIGFIIPIIVMINNSHKKGRINRIRWSNK